MGTKIPFFPNFMQFMTQKSERRQFKYVMSLSKEMKVKLFTN